jgi:hypothetical protein
MVKIKVSNANHQLSIFFSCVFLFIASVVFSVYCYEYYSENFILILFIQLILIYSIVVLFNCYLKNEYVSDMYIDNDEIVLVYKWCNIYRRTEFIKKNDIKKVYMSVHLNLYRSKGGLLGIYTNTTVSGYTFVHIKLHNGFVISFNADSSGDMISLDFEQFNLMFDLIKNANLLPNFEYKIDANEKIIGLIKSYLFRHGIDYKPTTTFSD